MTQRKDATNNELYRRAKPDRSTDFVAGSFVQKPNSRWLSVASRVRRLAASNSVTLDVDSMESGDLALSRCRRRDEDEARHVP
jgi:hypothetical protein